MWWQVYYSLVIYSSWYYLNLNRLEIRSQNSTNLDTNNSNLDYVKVENKSNSQLESTDKINTLRLSLIKEEFDELKDAIDKRDIKEVADALTDILYVTYGAGHAFGIDLDKCFEEVQSSNMSKLDNNGKPIYNDKGKVMKGPNYFKPNLTKFVA